MNKIKNKKTRFLANQWIALIIVLLGFGALITVVAWPKPKPDVPAEYEKIAIPSSLHLEGKRNLTSGMGEGLPKWDKWQYTYQTKEASKQAQTTLASVFDKAGFIQDKKQGNSLMFERKNDSLSRLTMTMGHDNDRTQVIVVVEGFQF